MMLKEYTIVAIHIVINYLNKISSMNLNNLIAIVNIF
jgi:hypothetical protein